MSTVARVHLERSGLVTRACWIEPSGNGLNYGQALPHLVDELDPLCESLGVPPIRSFLYSPWAAEGEPPWHDAADGLRTFSALLTELIYRLDPESPSDLTRPFVLCEVRAFELVLREAAVKQERFYIDV